MGPQQPQYYIGSAGSVAGPSKLRRSVKLLVVVTVAAIMIIIALKLLLPDNSPSGIATRFVDYITSDQANNSYALTSSAFRSQTSSSQWSQIVSSLHSSYAGNPKLQSSSNVVSTTSEPEVVFTVRGADSVSSYTLTVDLVNVGGKWQVNYFNSSTPQ
jgi:hypothetical protein